jgi:hypothetical protein
MQSFKTYDCSLMPWKASPKRKTKEREASLKWWGTLTHCSDLLWFQRRTLLVDKSLTGGYRNSNEMRGAHMTGGATHLHLATCHKWSGALRRRNQKTQVHHMISWVHINDGHVLNLNHGYPIFVKILTKYMNQSFGTWKGRPTFDHTTIIIDSLYQTKILATIIFFRVNFRTDHWTLMFIYI